MPVAPAVGNMMLSAPGDLARLLVRAALTFSRTGLAGAHEVLVVTATQPTSPDRVFAPVYFTHTAARLPLNLERIAVTANAGVVLGAVAQGLDRATAPFDAAFSVHSDTVAQLHQVAELAYAL